MLEDTFSTAAIDRLHLKLREEPLTEEKIVHYYLCLEPKYKSTQELPSIHSRRKEKRLSADCKHPEEFYMVLLYHLIAGYFRKEQLEKARQKAANKGEEEQSGEQGSEREQERQVPLADFLSRFIERTSKRNENLLLSSQVLRVYLDAIKLLHQSLHDVEQSRLASAAQDDKGQDV